MDLTRIIFHGTRFVYFKVHNVTRRLSTLANYNQKHDQEILFPKNPNKSSLLTNLPDYTYLDERVTPLGANQKKRILKQRELAQRIVTLSKEMDFALNRYNRIQEVKKQEKIFLLNSKLKPKGHLLLSINKKN